MVIGMQNIAAFLIKAIVAGIFSVACAAALTPAFAAFVNDDPNLSSAPVYALWFAILTIFLIVLLAPTVRRSLGRGFLILGASLFLLPLSALLLGGSVTLQAASAAGTSDDAAITASMGAAMTGGIAFLGGLFGFFVGSIALIFGLVLSLGGRREVVVVEGRSGPYHAASNTNSHSQRQEPPLKR